MSVDIPPILQAALDHFKDQGRKEIEVPEWDNLVIYASPMTLKERDRLMGGGGDIRLTVMADILILKAEDSNGEKIFTKHHKPHLMNGVDSEVVSRVALHLLSGPTVEDAEKN